MRGRKRHEGFTADELIAAIKAAATDSPDGGASLVRVGDWEGNLSANGLVETLEIKYDPSTRRIVIYCDPNEH